MRVGKIALWFVTWKTCWVRHSGAVVRPVAVADPFRKSRLNHSELQKKSSFSARRLGLH
jgi:hypothetical protein